ncbi:hypothetical protein [Micromonospora sp. CP22]|uniref:hypothetical protein n=1 Tax=Micromonospora sp. CP22 TaxID=2580517 RepID=UPI0012BBC936|nr:hypothetical protein [Micromonospora sp. CP22]MTK04043.1 hypothetical protein [Micromonospora sp. CP22]
MTGPLFSPGETDRRPPVGLSPSVDARLDPARGGDPLARPVADRSAGRGRSWRSGASASPEVDSAG